MIENLPRRRSMPVVAALSALLAACAASPSAFQPATDPAGDGYTVTQLENNRFRIGFTGNVATAHQTVDDDLLYLAAEVTLHHGADWFLISRASADKDTVYPTFVTAPSFYGGWGAPGSLGSVATDFNDPQDSWNETATILLYPGSKPPGNPDAYDARDVAVHLAPKITRATPPGPY